MPKTNKDNKFNTELSDPSQLYTILLNEVLKLFLKEVENVTRKDLEDNIRKVAQGEGPYISHYKPTPEPTKSQVPLAVFLEEVQAALFEAAREDHSNSHCKSAPESSHPQSQAPVCGHDQEKTPKGTSCGTEIPKIHQPPQDTSRQQDSLTLGDYVFITSDSSWLEDDTDNVEQCCGTPEDCKAPDDDCPHSLGGDPQQSDPDSQDSKEDTADIQDTLDELFEGLIGVAFSLLDIKRRVRDLR